jgi:hypothetical protein
MAWITPKLDWNENDWINYDDWNRIENNILELKNYLVGIQYNVPTPVSTNTTRNNLSIDFLSSINRIENNLDAIRLAFLSPSDYLPKETWIVGKGFDYSDANRLEKNTKSLLDWGMLVYQSFRYCGTFNCGQGWGLG